MTSALWARRSATELYRLACPPEGSNLAATTLSASPRQPAESMGMAASA
jgi:hypothetical protein